MMAILLLMNDDFGIVAQHEGVVLPALAVVRRCALQVFFHDHAGEIRSGVIGEGVAAAEAGVDFDSDDVLVRLAVEELQADAADDAGQMLHSLAEVGDELVLAGEAFVDFPGANLHAFAGDDALDVVVSPVVHVNRELLVLGFVDVLHEDEFGVLGDGGGDVGVGV